MIPEQLTLIQGGEFIVCDDIVYTPAEKARPEASPIRPSQPPRVTAKDESKPLDSSSLSATTSLPVNTMKATAVRLGDEIVQLPFIRSQERRVVSDKIRIDGPLATRIAQRLGIPPAVPASIPTDEPR